MFVLGGGDVGRTGDGDVDREGSTIGFFLGVLDFGDGEGERAETRSGCCLRIFVLGGDGVVSGTSNDGTRFMEALDILGACRSTRVGGEVCCGEEVAA